MKKLTALLLSVVLVLSLAACGSASKPASSTTQPETSAPTEQPATEPSESSSTTPEESEPGTQPETGKTLVVYYSASGNTERVAKDIAEAAGADLFEIVPTEVYTSDDLDWTNPDSRVSREHDDESLRDVPLTTTEVPDWDSYDTVFIGYPIWWLKQIRRLFISTLVVWENACKLPLANTSSINASCFARRRLDLFKSRYKSPSVGQGAV